MRGSSWKRSRRRRRKTRRKDRMMEKEMREVWRRWTVIVREKKEVKEEG